MKNIYLSQILITFLLIHPLNLFSQKKLAEIPVKIPRPTSVYLCSDSSGNIASVFQSNKFYEIDFLDSSLALTRTITTEKISADKNQKIIGAIIDQGQCTSYFYNSKLKAFSALSVNKLSGESSFSRVQVLNANDQFLRAFEMNGKFYILVVPNTGNSLKVLSLKGKQLEEMKYEMDMAGFYAALTKENERLNTEAESGVGIEEIKYDLENNIKSSYPTKKLYHFDDKIVMTFDEPGLTHMITIDLIGKKTDYKKLNFNLERGNNSRDNQGNSFLYQNRLFRTTISNEQLNVSILDLDSMNLLNSYNFYPNQDISILNGPIVQEGGTASYTTDEKILKRTDQYFRRVLEGNLAIAANKIDSNQYELQVGSYEIYNVNAYRNGFSSPGLSIGMGMGMGMGVGMGTGGMGMGNAYGGGMGYQGSYYNGFPGYYPYQSATRQRITYFKSLLGNEKFDHMNGSIPSNMKDKINEFEYRTFRTSVPEVLRIAPYQNSLLLVYYSRSERKLKVIEFRK